MATFVSATDRLLVASIDFGTTYSGYAFSFRHEYERDPLKVSANSWIDDGHSGLASWKTPTTLLLHPDLKFHSFGYKAEETYMELAEDGDHHEWFYFRRFKMLLHGRMKLTRDVEIDDATGKPLPALVVFSMSIRYLRDHLLDSIRRRGIEFSHDDILWVLTVPAIWNEPAKQFMREAAEQAGIQGDQLKLALEPEAASLYCMTVPLVKMQVDEDGKQRLGPFLPSTKYMVLDLGGGTVDVTVHEVLTEGKKLRELHKANGGAWGGTKVDSSYYSMYSEIFGAKIMDDFKTESKVDFLELEREFEQKKRNVKPDSKVSIRISAALKDFIQERTGETAMELIQRSRYGERIRLNRDRMTMQSDVIENLFTQSITSIVQHVKRIMQQNACQNLHKILLVGGFSESPLVRHAIQREFSGIVDVIAPDEPGLAVLKGAVIFGHSPNIITSRVARYTYGVAAQGEYMEGIHRQENKFVDKDGKICCRNLFSKFIEVDGDAAEGAAVSKVFEIADRHADMLIEIFMSEKQYPISTTEDGCSKLGEITIKVPLGGWRSAAGLQVDFDFGGTEFTVKAIETATQLEQIVKVDMLGGSSEHSHSGTQNKDTTTTLYSRVHHSHSSTQKKDAKTTLYSRFR